MYDEIDESGYTYKQPANAYEQPVAQQQPMSEVVHDGMYEMPDQSTNQSADKTLSLVGGGHLMRQGHQQSQMLYDMASASGQAQSNADQQHRQHQDSHALYMSDAARADAGPQASYSMASATVQSAAYDQAAMSTQATYNLAGQRMGGLNGNFVNDDNYSQNNILRSVSGNSELYEPIVVLQGTLPAGSGPPSRQTSGV